jgi:hypothetical protein
MSRISELLKKAAEGHRNFEIEQYREVLERIIPPMLRELKYNAKLCMSRLPPVKLAEKLKSIFASAQYISSKSLEVEYFDSPPSTLV